MTYRESIVERSQTGYPRRLAGVRDAPDRLCIRGALSEHDVVVAIVGSRAARARDIETARELAGALAERGVLVISGGALGVDTAAHLGALDHAAPTAAVLGCGIDVVYPERNHALFDRIVRGGGALVSQFPAGAPPRSWHFPRRNGTIAGMADATLVVAADARSGALQTARAAARLGRVVAAVPGSPGCERLIAGGAALVRCAADLHEALDGRPVRPAVALPASTSAAGAVLASLDHARPSSPDALADATGLGIREIQCALTDLELDGLVTVLPGHNYVRSTLARELLAQ